MTAADLPAVLALNNAHAAATSPHDADSLAGLVAMADVALVADAPGDAFLIGLFEGAAYASPNYRWFADRFPRFAYVDRVVVGERAQRRGLASALYGALFAAAADGGRDRVCAEVNSDPPNPVSDAFHAARGFFVVGEARLPAGKSVRYLTRRLRLTPVQVETARAATAQAAAAAGAQPRSRMGR